MENILTPSVVSVVTTAILTPIITAYLRRREEDRRRSYDMRYAEFKHYLRALDDLARGARENWKEIFVQQMSKVFSVLISPSSSNANRDQALESLNETLLTMTSRFQADIAKAEGELNGIRLVCSDSLLSMVNQFVRHQRTLVAEYGTMLGRWKEIDIANPESFPAPELSGVANDIEILYEKIVDQMRIELGVSKKGRLRSS